MGVESKLGVDQSVGGINVGMESKWWYRIKVERNQSQRCNQSGGGIKVVVESK